MRTRKSVSGEQAHPNDPQRAAVQFSFVRSIEYSAVAIILTLCVCLVINLAMPSGALRAGKNWLFDTYQSLFPVLRNTTRTVIVEIDDESIRRIGPWPWRRDTLAALVDAARDAKVVGLDILLAEADRLSPDRVAEALNISAPELRGSLSRLADPDTVLAAALRASPTVLAMTAEEAPDSTVAPPVTIRPIRERGDSALAALPHAGGVRWPLDRLAVAAHGIGIVSAPRSRSGEIDRLPAVVAIDGSVFPAFGLEVIATALKADTLVLTTASGAISSVSLDGLTIPTGAAGEIRPRFVGPDRLVRISAYRLLGPLADRSALRDHIVIIGVTARGVGDTFQIPLGIQESSPAIQAEFIESVMAGDALWRPPWARLLESAVALVAGVSAVLLLRRVPYGVYVVAFGGMVAVLIGGSITVFRSDSLLMDCVLPLTALFACGFVAIGLRIRTEIALNHRRDVEQASARVRQSAARREATLQSEADLLRQSLAFAVDAARLGVWDADLLGGSWHHSPRYDAILGLAEPHPNWSAALLLDQVVPEDLDMARDRFAEAEASGTLQLECRIAWPDGSVRHINVLGRFWRDADAPPNRVAGVVADITPQRQMELRLRQGEKMQAVGLLAGGVAHNFNNLLTVVLGSLELAQGRLDPSASARPLIGHAMEASRKCANIARQLLAFARVQPLRPQSVDPKSLLRTVQQMLRTALPERINVELETAPDIGAIRIDPVEFELALLNLGMNARDAMPAGGQLTIKSSAAHLLNPALGLDGHYLQVVISDTGDGIAPDKLPRVFEPFFTTKDIGQGTGLGLSQVHGFAHQSGGAVTIDSTPGKGTCVRLYLPSAPSNGSRTKSTGMEISS